MSDALDDIKTAMRGPDARIALVQTFTHGRGAQVYSKTRKVGPIIFPHEHQTLADVLVMLVEMAVSDE